MPIRRAPERRVLLPAVLVALLVAGVAASLALGSRSLTLGSVVEALVHPDHGVATAVVQGLRLPRTVLCVLVGAALGVAGVVMQAHTRNPLADPGLFGVSAGASFVVVLGIFAFHIDSQVVLVAMALFGAGAATVLVFGVAARGDTLLGPVPLALAGAAVSALLTALTTFLVLSDQRTFDIYRRWSVGSLTGRGFDVIAAVTPIVLAGLLLTLLHVRSLDAVALGDDVATGIGESTVRSRVVGLAAITLLAGGATAAAGPIGFLGLTVPHLGRALVGPGHAALVPVSALLGAILLLAADVVGRMIGVGEAEVQVGVVVALIGAPVFVAVARRPNLVTA